MIMSTNVPKLNRRTDNNVNKLPKLNGRTDGNGNKCPEIEGTDRW